ncbi:MAG: DUF3800 domain-containing protein [Lachnospiraceae bacterium]|nr:DUF3800 domain-containing protein [Lachnospiraceae bacterium]
MYCDESRQDLLANKEAITSNNRYVSIGGLLVPRDKRDLLKQRLNDLKLKYGIVKEFKWGNVSENKLDFYKALVNLFFEAEFRDVCFRCVVIDALEIDNEKYNDDDQELGYYKFYYQLIHNWVNSRDKYYIFTDYKTNKEKDRLQELRRILNRQFVQDNVEIIQAIDSAESVILQFQNILMGTVSYKYNYRENGSSIAKLQLVSYVEEKLGRKIGATNSAEYKFNIFRINLSGGNR